MPAKSKKQQKLFGLIEECKKTGKCASQKIRKIANSMTSKQIKDFASTKTKKLPNKVKKK